MSAFLCSPLHIGTLARWFIQHEPGGFRDWRSPEGVARALATANVASVAYRYEQPTLDKCVQEWYGMLNLYTYQERCAEESRRPVSLTLVEVLKMCRCLEYQSCERPDWLGSDAWLLLETIRDTAISLLPGYEEAPWELVPKEEEVAT